MFSKILLAIDGSRHADKAMKTAKDLLKMNNDLQITILNVTEVPNTVFGLSSEVSPVLFEQSSSCSSQKLLESAQEFFSMDGFEVNILSRFGSPATIICELAKYENYDMILVGSRGLSAIKGLFMGSVSNQVAHLAHCPVLIVK